MAFNFDVDPKVLAAIVVGGIIILSALWPSKRTMDLPSPPGYPYVGNLLQLGQDHAMTYADWAKKYGDVYQVRLGNRDVVIVNSAAAAKKLFIDQGHTYISRPLFYTFHKVVSSTAGYTIGSSPWDESCKRKRKAAATGLNRVAVQSYVPIIEEEVRSLLNDIYIVGEKGKKSINPMLHLQRFALNVSLVLNYGTRLADVSDTMFQEIVRVETEVANFRSVSGSYQDYLPILRLIPNSETQKKAGATRKARDNYMDKLLQGLKNEIADGKDRPCIAGSILKDPEVKLDAAELSSVCLSMVSAGLDTLANTMIWSCGTLAKYPEVQEKAYEAIKQVYGNEPLDVYEEKVDYITALHKESSRFFSVLKLGLPRATLGESEYEGHKIPSGTTVFYNTWAIHHDENRYPNSNSFNPERFMGEDEHVAGQAHYGFGIGRRLCAGTFLANRELYMAFGLLLQHFEIKPSDIESEREYDINPWTACANPRGLSHSPKSFKIRFVPRDPANFEKWLASPVANQA